MRFVAKRLLLFIAALVGLSILVFLALRVLPGDVAAVMAGTNATAARIAALRTQMGLDRPLPVQYVDWLGGLLHGDLGISAICKLLLDVAKINLGNLVILSKSLTDSHSHRRHQ